MKIFYAIILVILPMSVLAYDYQYDVSGSTDNGSFVDGTIYSNKGDQQVYGEITDENGVTHQFDGYWDGYGHISGQTESGESVELDTY